jgi:hypothetical protein
VGRRDIEVGAAPARWGATGVGCGTGEVGRGRRVGRRGTGDSCEASRTGAAWGGVGPVIIEGHEVSI